MIPTTVTITCVPLLSVRSRRSSPSVWFLQPRGWRGPGLMVGEHQVLVFSLPSAIEWQKSTQETGNRDFLAFSKSTGFLQPAEDLVLVGARHTHIMAARHRERLSERCHDVIGTSALPRFPRAYAGGSANALALVMHALCICPERNYDYSRTCSPVTQTPRSKYGCPLASPLALTLQMQSPAPPAPHSGRRAETLDDVMVRARSLRGGLRTECMVECALVRTSCL